MTTCPQCTNLRAKQHAVSQEATGFGAKIVWVVSGFLALEAGRNPPVDVASFFVMASLGVVLFPLVFIWVYPPTTNMEVHKAICSKRKVVLQLCVHFHVDVFSTAV